MGDTPPTGLDRITRLEARFDALKDKVGELQNDIAHIEAWQENTSRTLQDVAGMMRDQAVTRRILSKVGHFFGYILTAVASAFATHWSSKLWP